jgi:hypothetical protein
MEFINSVDDLSNVDFVILFSLMFSNNSTTIKYIFHLMILSITHPLLSRICRDFRSGNKKIVELVNAFLI